MSYPNHLLRDLQGAAFESISDAIIVCDELGAVLLANRAMRALLAINHDAALPAHVRDLPFQRLGDGAAGVQVDGGDYVLGERTFHTTPSPLIDHNGQTRGSLLVFHDTSREVAAKTNAMQFIGGMSHELGRPLTTIAGNLDLLLRGYIGALSDDQKELVQQARDWTGRLSTVVRNTVTVADIEANQTHMEILPLAPVAVIKDALIAYKQRFASKQIEVTTTSTPDLPDILADSQHLRHVLTQLVDNAYRFTPSGQVTIDASSDDTQVRIDIRDTGMGIPLSEQARLFSRFHLVRSTDSVAHGSGLGLYIARQLLERQGGRIWLEASSEQGSTFSLTLPRAVLN